MDKLPKYLIDDHGRKYYLTHWSETVDMSRREVVDVNMTGFRRKDADDKATEADLEELYKALQKYDDNGNPTSAV